MNIIPTGPCYPSDPTTCLTLFPDLTDLCGDAIRTGPEEWDDGNTDPDDGWSSTWTKETGYYCIYGNSTTVDTWGEVCTDGRKVGNEECDDGNHYNGDGCSIACKIEEGYQCSGGNITTEDTWTDVWGDSKLMNPLPSSWEDGNVISGDGWTDLCQIEFGYSWEGGTNHSADTCQSGCGNGKREGIE